MLRPAEIVGAEMAATREGAAVFALPTGIAGKDDFFDAARASFPMHPPLALDADSWEELGESLRQGLIDLVSTAVVIWPDPWLLEDFEPETARVAVELLSELANDLPGVTTILGTRGI